MDNATTTGTVTTVIFTKQSQTVDIGTPPETVTTDISAKHPQTKELSKIPTAPKFVKKGIHPHTDITHEITQKDQEKSPLSPMAIRGSGYRRGGRSEHWGKGRGGTNVGGTSRFAGWGRGGRMGERTPHVYERIIDPREKVVLAAIETVQSLERRRYIDTDNRWREKTPVNPAVKDPTPEEMENTTKDILDKYLLVRDIKGPVIYVTQMSPKHHHLFVYDSINHVLDTSPVARKLMGDMLHDLVKYKVVAIDNFVSGLFEALEFAEDMAIDIPKIWQYYGELMRPVIQEDSVPISLLSEPTAGSSKAGLMLVKVLQEAQREAINGPKFSVAYANLCRCLSTCKVPSETKQYEMVNFRALLMAQCQRKFEKDKSSEKLFAEKRKDIENAEESSKEEMKQISEYEESKAKRRSLGNIRFSALSKPDNASSRRYGGASPTRGDSRGRGFGRPPSLISRQSQESEREKAVAAAKAIGSSQSMESNRRERSRGRDLDSDYQEKPAAPASTAVKELTAEEMEKKTKAILDEYLHTGH